MRPTPRRLRGPLAEPRVTEDILSNPRFRRLGFGVFLIVSSVVAGYGVYQGRLKILAILGLFTLGFLLRQASIRNAYWLTITSLQFAVTRFGGLRDEFETDRWIALAGMAALSLALVAFHASDLAWPSMLHVFALGILTLAASSSAWSPHPSISFAKAGSVGLAFVVAYVGMWSHCTRVDRVQSVADVHADMLWIVFPLGLLAWLLPIPGKLMAGRLTSIFENPNALGVWCSMGLPLCLGLALSHPVAWRRRACWVLLGTGAVVAVLSGSRGGVLGAMLGIGLYAGMRWSRWTLAFTALAAVVGTFVVLYGIEIVNRSDMLMTLVRPSTLENLSDRRYWWVIGVEIAKQHPWLGHGFGIGTSLFVSYGLDVSQGTYAFTIHNSYLAAWMEIGALGVGLVLASLGWTAWLGIRTWRHDPKGQAGLLALALTASAVAVAAHSFVEGILFGAGNPWMLPYWVTLALVARLHRLQRDAATARAREASLVRPPRFGMTAAPQ